jgi:hypothetical protein
VAERRGAVAVRSRRWTGMEWIDAGGPVRYGVDGWRLLWQTRRGGGAMDLRCGGGPARLRVAERRWIDDTAVDQRALCKRCG